MPNTQNCDIQSMYPNEIYRKAIYADFFVVHCNYSLGNKILTRSVCGNNCRNYVIRHVVIICKKLLGILRETIAAVTEGLVIVVRAE